MGLTWAGVVYILCVSFASGDGTAFGGSEAAEEFLSCFSVETVGSEVFWCCVTCTVLPLVHDFAEVREGFGMFRVVDEIVELVVVVSDIEERFGRSGCAEDIGLCGSEVALLA